MKFSIITVVYNDIGNLKVTYESVKTQIYNDYEFIVIDGKSSDGTVEYLSELEKNDKHVRYLSDKDNGIYDAMNKGISIAKGDYIIFLGAADTFYSNDILQEISSLLTEKVDILYGKVLFSSGERAGSLLGAKATFISLLFDKYIAHQSVFAKREILLKIPFDLNYRFLADQDFMYKTKKMKYNLKFIDKIICNYDGDGFSSSIKNRKELEKERIKLIYSHSKIAYIIRNTSHIIRGLGSYNLSA